MDDTKISHKDPRVADEILKGLESKFGNMCIKRGNKHTFVRTDIEFASDGRIKITMSYYINECIERSIWTRRFET